MKKYNNTIFIFRRDFRLDDNIGLIQSLHDSGIVIPIFILTYEQLIKNPYKSDNSIQFMMESLDDLYNQLKKKGSKLFYFFGKPHEIINLLIIKLNIDAIYVNRDYSPYSKLRDEKIQKICNNNKINFHSFEDILLHPVGSIRTNNNNIYVKFTPFFNSAKKNYVFKPIKNNFLNYCSYATKITNEFKGNIHNFYKYNKKIAVNGGRELSIKILNNIHIYKNYNKNRNIMNISTTKLSAYIKFGCVSIREVYYKIKEKLGIKNDLIKQLYWREFYYNITEYNPNILSHDWKEKNFNKKFNKIKWLIYETANENQKKQFDAWRTATTGYPLIDACQKELLTTGFMHNRGRLIVGSFLVKNLFFHWAEGEKFFSNHLIDLDLPNNTNNWLWLSSAGVDSQPFFRIFSPILQSKQYDQKCEYIKKWLPELKNVENKHIHEWYKYYKLYSNINYPEPIIDYSISAKKTIEKYKNALYN